jgi:hypothetical protein
MIVFSLSPQTRSAANAVSDLRTKVSDVQTIRPLTQHEIMLSKMLEKEPADSIR